VNAELTKTHQQLLDEINRMWFSAASGDYGFVVEQAETLLILAKHAQEIVEREER